MATALRRAGLGATLGDTLVRSDGTRVSLNLSERPPIATL
jgi:hypothetical protein